MESEPRPQLSQRRRRKRPALSCRECRRRKIRCDHNTICANCLRHKTVCVYKPYMDDDDCEASPRNAPQQHDFPGSSLHPTTASLSRLGNGRDFSPVLPNPASRQLVQAEEDTGNLTDQASISQQHGHVLRPLNASIPTPDEPSGMVTFHDLILRIQRLEEASVSGSRVGCSSSPSGTNARSETNRGPVARRASVGGTQEWQTVLEKPREQGKSRSRGAANEFATIIACYIEIMGKSSNNAAFHTPEASALVFTAIELLQKCKNRARRIKTGRPTRGLQLPDSGFATHSREKADVMVNLYLTSFESTYRILHIPTFWSEYHKYWDNRDALAPSVRLKVLLVIGIGSSLYDHGDRAAALRNIDVVQQWVYAAQTWLSGPLEKDRLDISGLQIYCLSILARQIFSIGGDTIWISIGSLVHSAMQIGLHRDPRHLKTVSVLQAELQRRLWYTIVEFAAQASLDSWMPPRISFDEFDTQQPLNINDDMLDERTTEIHPYPNDTFTTASFQRFLIESLPIRLRITQLLNGLHSEPSYNNVLALSSELIDAVQTNSHRATNDDKSTPFQRNMLDYLVRRFIIPLHYSFSNQACTNPLFHYSLKLSLDAALALLSPEPDPSFTRLMATGGGMFREGIRCATSAISLELLTHVETQRQNGTLHRTRRYLHFLKQAVRDVMLLSEERIRLGETNVKNHMFLSMILAQAEAMEMGVPVEYQVAKAAKDSLDLCNDLLKTREDTCSKPSPENTAPMGEVQEPEWFALDLGWESIFPGDGFHGMDL